MPKLIVATQSKTAPTPQPTPTSPLPFTPLKPPPLARSSLRAPPPAPAGRPPRPPLARGAPRCAASRRSCPCFMNASVFVLGRTTSEVAHSSLIAMPWRCKTTFASSPATSRQPRMVCRCGWPRWRRRSPPRRWPASRTAAGRRGAPASAYEGLLFVCYVGVGCGRLAQQQVDFPLLHLESNKTKGWGGDGRRVTELGSASQRLAWQLVDVALQRLSLASHFPAPPCPDPAPLAFGRLRDMACLWHLVTVLCCIVAREDFEEEF